MSSQINIGRLSWSRVVFILAIISLCCFMFAGLALAQPALEITPDVVKGSHTYDYQFEANIENLGLDVKSFYGENPDVCIDYPAGFDLSKAVGKAVPIEVIVSGNPYYMQIVPTISGTTACFDFQSANLTQQGVVEAVYIKGLRVINHHVPGDYRIIMRHTQLFTLYRTITVVETVGQIIIDSPVTCTNIKAGATFEVKGRVIGTCNVPWPYTSWPVKIEILDKKGRLAKVPIACQCPIEYSEDGQPISAGGTPLEDMERVCTHTVYDDVNKITTFTATLQMPGYKYKYDGSWTNDYIIKASTVEVKDAYSNPSSNLVPAESLEDIAETTLVGCPKADLYAYLNIHHWYCDFTCDDTGYNRAIALSDPVTVHMVPAEPVKMRMVCPPDKIKLGAPVDITVCLMDKYCNDAPAIKQEKIDLAALTDPGNEMAGRFYDAAGNEISHVYVPVGKRCVTVVFRPIVKGPIVIEARAEDLTSPPSDIIIVRCETTVIDSDEMALDLIPKVTDENGCPRAGWPVKGSYYILPVGATEDYKVHVEITDCDGNFYRDLNGNGMYDVGEEVATWGIDPGTLDFMAKGPYMGHNICQPWDTKDHLFCNTKQHIWIYPNIWMKRCTVPGYEDPTIKFPDCLNVKVVVEGPAGTEVMTVEGTIDNFVSPVELMRSLNAEAWQTLSTPKTLAGAGDLKSLIGDSYDLALTYRNGKWEQLKPGEELQPLYCYYVKMKQPKDPGEESEQCYWNAAYIFDRATDPSEMIPPVRTMGIGWQAVGMAVQDTNPGDDNLWQQSDYLYRALGTICKCCKIVYNPGFPKVENPHYPELMRTRLGNLADFQTVAVSQGTGGAWWDDPYAVVYNGDNYWIYMCETQDLAANVGLEIVDP